MIAMEFRFILIGLGDAPTNAHGSHDQYAQRLQLMLHQSDSRNLSIAAALAKLRVALDEKIVEAS